MAALHERLRFDTARGEVLDDDRRYVLLRADVLMGLFASLPADTCRQALEAFGASAFAQGSASVRAYAQTLPAGEAQTLFQVVGDGASSLGWGVWRYEHGPDGSRLLVHNSPFARHAPVGATPCCTPIAGIFRAVCEQAWGQTAIVQESSCAANRGAAVSALHACVFEARKNNTQRTR